MKQRTVFFWCALIAALVWAQAGRAQSATKTLSVRVAEEVRLELPYEEKVNMQGATNVTFTWTSNDETYARVCRKSAEEAYVNGCKVTSTPVRVDYHCTYLLDGYYHTIDLFYLVHVTTRESIYAGGHDIQIPAHNIDGLRLYPGETKIVSASTSYSQDDVIWYSSSPDIATAKNSQMKYSMGFVEALQPGVTLIKCYLNAYRTSWGAFVLTVLDDGRTIIYETADGKWRQQYKVPKGKPYPTPDAGYMVEFSGVPTGYVTDAGTFTLNYTTRYNIAPTVDDIQQYYTLDIDGQHPVFSSQITFNKTNLYALGCSDETEPLRYDRGAAPDDTYAWAFVGDPFGQVQLYGKDAKTFLQVGGEALSFTAIHPETYAANEIALKADGQYLSRNGTALGTSATLNPLRAFPIQAAEATYTRTFGAAYGTLVLPFYAPIPDGMTAYTCATVDGNTLQLTAVADQLLPNTPYIVENAEGATFTFANTSLGNYTDPVSEGLLTGIYAAAEAPTGSFVLQKQNGVLGFYQVETPVTVQPNRCYLTLDGSLAKAFYFSTTSTAVDALEALTNRSTEIYDLQGRRLQRLQKGVNIVGGHKVFVK